MQRLAPQEPDYRSRASSSIVGNNAMPLNLDRHTATIKALLDSCGHKIGEIQTKLESLERDKISVQMMVAT